MKHVFWCPSQVDPALTGIKRKKTYNSYTEAQAVDPGQRPYRCPYCDKWHLTTRKRSKKRSKQ